MGRPDLLQHVLVVFLLGPNGKKAAMGRCQTNTKGEKI
jgi:hypothetical protein